ncbi:MAG TPA: zinc-binding dehydrogenase [Chthoniobacteraceae bacterium]|nr:zinc-binding dehydrogenase [Chthoniobacteraceae bacterium]
MNPTSAHRPSLMKAAVLMRPGNFEIREVTMPQPGRNEVRVRIESCGVCASNIPPFEGRSWFSYPFKPGALGHEACGRIDAAGCDAGREWTPGQRVAFLSYHSFAEYDLAHSQAVVALPPELDDQPVLAEPIACAMNIFRRSAIREGDTVAVVGSGFLGTLLTQLAVAQGAKVFAFSRRKEARKLAMAYGAQQAFPLACAATALEQVREATADRLCDVVVEATGKQEPLTFSAEITRERGRLVIAGYHQDGARQIDMQLWNWRGLDVINAHEREQDVYIRGMRDGLEALKSGRLRTDGLLTHHLRLEELDEALELTRTRPPGFMKAIVRP